MREARRRDFLGVQALCAVAALMVAAYHAVALRTRCFPFTLPAPG